MSDQRRQLLSMIKRDLPLNPAPSKWCGIHEKERTVLVARRQYVCLECVREKRQ